MPVVDPVASHGGETAATSPGAPRETPPPAAARRRPAWWLAVAGVVLAGGLVAYGWQRQETEAAAAADVANSAVTPSVRVHVVAPPAGAAKLTLPATLEPVQRTVIHARASGYVKRWYSDLGDTVQAGAVLAELETPDLEQDVRRAQAAVAEARAGLVLAQTTAERARRLLEQQAIARQEIDASDAELRVREAELVAAEAALSRVEELIRFQTIRAPIAGTITARRIEVGDLVVAGAGGSGLFVIEQTNTLRAFVDLPQAFARWMQPKLKAKFELPEAPGRHFDAEVVRTAGALNAATRSMRVELQLPNPAGELLSGAFGQVRIELPRAGDVVAVPGNAVRIRSEGAFVALVDAADQIVIRPVKLGHDLGREIEIVQGLRPGERVVLNPSDLLRAGAPVHVVQATAQR